VFCCLFRCLPLYVFGCSRPLRCLVVCILCFSLMSELLWCLPMYLQCLPMISAVCSAMISAVCSVVISAVCSVVISAVCSAVISAVISVVISVCQSQLYVSYVPLICSQCFIVCCGVVLRCLSVCCCVSVCAAVTHCVCSDRIGC
jgi:hypothetical protein